MSGHDHHGDCGYDYNNSWDYEHCKPRKQRRPRRRRDNCWEIGGY